MFVEINGLKINYLYEGVQSAPVLLLLHGWGCSGETYRKIINQLTPRFKVIAPDLPGFGKSPEPPSALDVGGYALLVRDFCKALNLENITLFGHSLGCRIIIKLLAEGFSIATGKVIFTGAAGIKPKITASRRFKILFYKTGKFLLTPFPKLIEKLQNKSGSADYRAASPMMRQCLVKIVNEDLTPLLPLIKNEVLLIWGESDDSTPLADGRLMEKTMPNAGLAVIQKAAHYAFFEQPELFMKILNSYLGEANAIN